MMHLPAYLNVATNRVHCVFGGWDSRGSRFLQPPEIDQLLLCSEKFWPGKHSILSQPHEKTINFINFVNVHHSPGGPNVKEYWYQPRKKTVYALFKQIFRFRKHLIARWILKRTWHTRSLMRLFKQWIWL